MTAVSAELYKGLKMDHIAVLNIVEGQQVYLIADPHGSAEELRAVIRTIKQENKGKKIRPKLIILGDLFDRGKDSVGVIECVLQEDGNDIDIHCIRGNHEDHFLRYVEALEAERNNQLDPEKDREKINALTFYRKSICKDKKPWVDELEESDKQRYYNYVKKLPYLLQVNRPDKSKFYCAHAGINLTDKQLEEIIATKTDLTASQIDYMTEARRPSYASAVTLENVRKLGVDATTYGGHTPFDGVRVDTAEIILDVSTCTKGYFLVVNDTQQNCFICNAKGRVKDISAVPPQVITVYHQINLFLNFNKQSAKDIDAYIMTNYVNKQSDIKTRKEQYLAGLANLKPALSPNQRVEMADYLLQPRCEHLLKEERDFFRLFQMRSFYSSQTYSMHKAIDQLVDCGLKIRPSGFISWIWSFFQPEQKVDIKIKEESYTFSRHVSPK